MSIPECKVRMNEIFKSLAAFGQTAKNKIIFFLLFMQEIYMTQNRAE